MSAQSKLDSLFDKMRKCTACGLRKTCTQVVPGEGFANANVAFFAESPGKDEDREGRPLIGSSGQFWRQGLRRFGLSEGEIFISSAVKCRPPDSRDPYPDEKEVCWEWTLEILKIVRPKVIVALGRHALEGFSKNFEFSIGQKGIKKIAGKAIYIPERNFYVYPMFHPAHALRNGSAREEFYAHLSFLKQSLPGWLSRPPMPPEELAARQKKKAKKVKKAKKAKKRPVR